MTRTTRLVRRLALAALAAAAVPAALAGVAAPAAAQAQSGGYTMEEIVGEGHRFFGATACAASRLVRKTVSSRLR